MVMIKPHRRVQCDPVDRHIAQPKARLHPKISYCHLVIWLSDYLVIWLSCYLIILLSYHLVILLSCLIILFCYIVIWLSYLIILSSGYRSTILIFTCPPALPVSSCICSTVTSTGPSERCCARINNWEHSMIQQDVWWQRWIWRWTCSTSLMTSRSSSREAKPSDPRQRPGQNLTDT